MSVTGPSNSSTSAASSRLAVAIAKTTTPHEGATPTVSADAAVTTKATAKAATKPSVSVVRTSTGATRDAVRGASAGPDDVTATGSTTASSGARNVQSVGPGADTASGTGATAYSPSAASSDSYAAADGQPATASSATGTGSATSTTTVAGTGAWSPKWQATFEALQLAPADVAYLAQGGYDEAQLGDIATQLSTVDVLDPSAPAPGVEAGSATSADGPTAADLAPAGQPGFDSAEGAASVQSAWSPEWKAKFSDVMERMGMPANEIEQQLAAVEGQPTTEQQLTAAYSQMEGSLGDFDDSWKDKFSTLMTALKVPAPQQKEALAQLAGSGMTEAKLQEAYTQMEASKPAWSSEWEGKFTTLDVPAEMLTQLKASGAPKEALEAQFQKLLDTKMKYNRDGRLEKLVDAGATPAEKWGIMLEGKQGKEFDKLVEQVHSSHVSGWKRAGSFALNLIPGVFAVQYLTGKDWVTGTKIDRSNPLNFIGAVASGFAGFTAVRSAVAGVQGLSAASRAATATMQTAKAATGATGLAASVESLGSASALSKGAFQAIEGAGLVSKFEKGLKFTDYLKAATPLVNRFGEAGRLSAVGRGYTQGMQLAAGAAALKTVEGGGAAVDKATKGAVIGQLKEGKGIEAALASTPRSGAVFTPGDIAKGYNGVGFLQGSVGKAVDGARVMRGSGNATFNPFKNTNTISSTNNPNVLSLGKSVNFAKTGGLSQGIGAVQGVTFAGNAGVANHAINGANKLMNASNAGRMSGLNIVDDGQRMITYNRTAKWAKELGAGQGEFRSLLQLGGTNGRSAARITGMVENGGSTGYRAARQTADVARRFGGFVATPLVAGAAVGLTGRQLQPGWDYLKNRDEIQAKEQAARGNAEQEQQDLERLYQEQQASGTGTAPTAGSGSASGTATGGETQVVGTSPTGGELVYDPSYGAVIDSANGDVYDPQTGAKLGNLATGATSAEPGVPATGAAPATEPAGGTTGEVFRDPATGYYVDPATGLMADPTSGKVYDPKTGQVVGNVSTAQGTAA